MPNSTKRTRLMGEGCPHLICCTLAPSTFSVRLRLTFGMSYIEITLSSQEILCDPPEGYLSTDSTSPVTTQHYMNPHRHLQLPFHHLTLKMFKIFQPLSLILLVRVRNIFWLDSLYTQADNPPGRLRSSKVHNN
jgi:hypothetical protein